MEESKERSASASSEKAMEAKVVEPNYEIEEVKDEAQVSD